MGTEDLDWLHDDEDGQDGDGNGRESEEAEMRREWQCRFEKLHNVRACANASFLHSFIASRL